MKYAIPLGAVLLIGIALSLHRSPARPAPPEGPSAVRKDSAPPAAETARAESAPPVPALSASASPAERKGTASAAVPAAGSPKQLRTLEQSVGLTSAQRPVIEQVLRDRESEIRAYHQSIRKAGVLDLQEFGWKSDLMKESWYRRIDALLDAAQHERFLALVEKGFLGEGLEFTIEPGLTVLD